MKARVKATGEIVEVTRIVDRYVMAHHPHTIIFEKDELDFNVDDNPDYWTRLEHQYAGMAMNALLLTNNIRNGDLEGMRECNTNAMAIAYALIQELKEKEERK